MAGTSVSAWRRPRDDLEQGDHALVPADGHAHLLGRGLDAEDQHGARHGASAPLEDRPNAPPTGGRRGVTTMSRVHRRRAGDVVVVVVVVEASVFADVRRRTSR